MVQKRYGFTDEYILSLPYARFMDMVETISEVKAEELREKYRLAAFTSYLLGAGTEGETFQDFQERIGIANNSTSNNDVTPQDDNVTKEQALNKAKEILAKFQWTERSR